MEDNKQQRDGEDNVFLEAAEGEALGLGIVAVLILVAICGLIVWGAIML